MNQNVSGAYNIVVLAFLFGGYMIIVECWIIKSQPISSHVMLCNLI